MGLEMSSTMVIASRVVTRGLPYLLAGIGVIADALTTLLGLSLGFAEAHPHYHPLMALLVFWAVIFAAETSASGRCRHLALALASLAFVGALHNALILCTVGRL